MSVETTSSQEDKHIYYYMPRVLRISGIIGAVILVIGLLLLHIKSPAPRQATSSEGMLIAAMFHLNAVSWLHAGILVLMATPILGLLTAAVAAIFDADWRLFLNCLLLFLLLWLAILLR